MIESQQDTKASHILNPIFDNPKVQQHYLGKVRTRFEDESDAGARGNGYKITFDILGLPEFNEGEGPIATLLGSSTRVVEVGQIVKIWDICDASTGLHTFMYEPLVEERFTGIKNGDNYIDMTEANYCEIKLPNAKIIFDRHKGSKTEHGGDGDDGQIGSVKIELKGAAGNGSIEWNVASGMLNINGGTAIKINAVEEGPAFNCIPICPYTGAPHVTAVVPCL